jgi:hypothetical protein
VISGTPAAAGVWGFVVRAREPFRRSGERQLTLTVAAALQARAAVPAGERGLRYTGSVPATGGVPPLTWSVASGALPRGLALDPATGAIRGIPRVAGVFAVTFAVTDAAEQRVAVPASIRIAARLAIATTRLPRATAGSSYSARLRASGGLRPVRWTVVGGELPRGIQLDRVTGILTGTPRTPGVYRFAVRGTDRLGVTARKAFRLVVAG